MHAAVQALYDCDELDDYIDKHAPDFTDYSEEGEQRVEWTRIHEGFVARIEARVAQTLEQLGSSAANLSLVLQRTTMEKEEADPRANSFVRLLLCVSEYRTFATCMRDGGSALKISSEDVKAMSYRLCAEELELLRKIVQELYDYDELDEYITER